MCKVSLEKRREIFSEENREDMKEKSKVETQIMISEIKQDPNLSTEEKDKLIQKLAEENEMLNSHKNN